MNIKHLSLALCILFSSGCLYANPYTMPRISKVSAFPPEIEIDVPHLFGHESIDLSGFKVYTMTDTAVINDGITMTDEYFSFDSSNTSGFTINPEGDCVFLDIEVDNMPFFDNPEYFGNCGPLSPPLKGHPTVLTGYFSDHRTAEWPWFFLAFDFAQPDQGWTDIIINEINANSTWGIGTNFIELYNTLDEPRSLAGWQIVCDTIYDLPNDAYIAANGYYVIDECDFPPAFDMDIEADNIYLISPDPLWIHDGPRIVDQVGWSSDHGENSSFMRYPDGDVDSTIQMRDFLGYNDYSSTTFEDGFPTRGAANRLRCPGFVIIAAKADSLDDSTAKLTWTNPIWDDQFDCAVLVKSFYGYVTDPDDGNIIYEGVDQQFIEMYIEPEVEYFYTVFAKDLSGNYSTPTTESQAYIVFHGAGAPDELLPSKTACLSSYPNPFNAQTSISFILPDAGEVEIAIYDITGRLIETVANDYYVAGEHSVNWNALEHSSGIYFAKLSSENINAMNKLVLLK